MLRITGLFTVLFASLLTIFWSRSYDPAPAVAFLWHYDLLTRTESARPAELQNGAPFNLVESNAAPVDSEGEADAENKAESALVGPDAPAIARESNERVFVPFHGAGYFKYAKIGRELSFYGRSGEELWRKPYKAYPVSDVRGRLVLLLTGDNNRIDLLDANGNPNGVKSVAGNFMTDFDFASRRSAAAITFSTGTLSVIDEQGRALLNYEYETTAQPLFVKSCALSPDAGLVALHLLAGDRDRIVVLRPDLETEAADDYAVERDIEIDTVYPHLLHFALNEHGVLIVAPDRTQYFALAGGSDRVLESQPENSQVGPVYRAVFADRDYFVYDAGAAAVVLDESGRQVLRLNLQTQAPFRLLPGPLDRQFAIHTRSAVEIYAYRPRGSH